MKPRSKNSKNYVRVYCFRKKNSDSPDCHELTESEFKSEISLI